MDTNCKESNLAELDGWKQQVCEDIEKAKAAFAANVDSKPTLHIAVTVAIWALESTSRALSRIVSQAER